MSWVTDQQGKKGNGWKSGRSLGSGIRAGVLGAVRSTAGQGGELEKKRGGDRTMGREPLSKPRRLAPLSKLANGRQKQENALARGKGRREWVNITQLRIPSRHGRGCNWHRIKPH